MESPLQHLNAVKRHTLPDTECYKRTMSSFHFTDEDTLYCHLRGLSLVAIVPFVLLLIRRNIQASNETSLPAVLFSCGGIFDLVLE